MKKITIYFLLFTALITACSNPVKFDIEEAPELPAIPKKPSPIAKIPTDLICSIGSEFTLTVNETAGVKEFKWNIECDDLILVEGQGTHSIIVRLPMKECVIPAQSVSVSAINELGESKPRVFYGEILVERPRVPEPAPIESLTSIKQYGNKIWMTANLDWEGLQGDLGLMANNDSSLKCGRLYTWYEALTGLPNATTAECPYKPGYSGVDDAGYPFTMDGSAEGEYSVQIQGVCPNGWHVANIHDWYDLVVSIKTEYNVPDKKTDGGYLQSDATHGRNDAIKSFAIGDWGCVGAWLRSGKRVSDGGMWNTTALTFSASGVVYPLFVNGAEEVGFGLLPVGRSTNGTAVADQGKYSYFWTPYNKDATTAYRYTVGATNTNLSTSGDNKGYRESVRCVKNYQR